MTLIVSYKTHTSDIPWKRNSLMQPIRLRGPHQKCFHKYNCSNYSTCFYLEAMLFLEVRRFLFGGCASSASLIVPWDLPYAGNVFNMWMLDTCRGSWENIYPRAPVTKSSSEHGRGSGHGHWPTAPRGHGQVEGRYSGCAPVRNFLIRNYPLGAWNTMKNY